MYNTQMYHKHDVSLFAPPEHTRGGRLDTILQPTPPELGKHVVDPTEYACVSEHKQVALLPAKVPAPQEYPFETPTPIIGIVSVVETTLFVIQ
jgi:hypothetical protein